MQRFRSKREKLLWRIGRRYAIVTEPLEIGPMTLQFTRVADPNRVLDEVAEAEDRREKLTGRRRNGEELHLPYWAELWDSALGLGAFLAEQSQALNEKGEVGEWESGAKGRSPHSPTSPFPIFPFPTPPPPHLQNILDLGCGMGLAGTVAARLGARVLFADLEAPPLLFARLNSLPDANRVRTRRLDWRLNWLEERFDLILGADILYERLQWHYLEPFWRAHLKPGGAVLLGEPGRQTGDAFVDWIAAQGWRLERFDQPVSTRPHPVRIFSLRLSRNPDGPP